MKKSIRTKPKRGRPTSHAFASNRHQRPTGKLLFPNRKQVISGKFMLSKEEKEP